MPSVKAAIIIVWIALLLLSTATPVLVGWEWRRAHDPHHVTLRARYRRGRHHHPRLWTRLGAALADGWREAAEAQALLRGAQPWI